MTAAAPILEIDGLSLESKGKKKLLNGVSFALYPGESLGLVGESGSGKTLTLRAAAGLLPSGVIQTGGQVTCTGGRAMIFQDPVSSLDPLAPAAAQLAEVAYYRQHLSRKEARTAAVDLLTMLGLPGSLARRYPHQLSGGQCQRILIAMALACKPRVLLCDEPTTALDVTVQRQILEIIGNLQKELGFAILFVTHNLAIASAMCSGLCVMKDGRIVERGSTAAVLQNPRESYTRMLIEAVLPLPDQERSAGA
ncbi:MAG: ABC transporter ATP-binding protein [Treponema sp.]|nr:ABC transporter ATP-binding protein [Treponema sp.]